MTVWFVIPNKETGHWVNFTNSSVCKCSIHITVCWLYTAISCMISDGRSEGANAPLPSLSTHGYKLYLCTYFKIYEVRSCRVLHKKIHSQHTQKLFVPAKHVDKTTNLWQVTATRLLRLPNNCTYWGAPAQRK